MRHDAFGRRSYGRAWYVAWGERIARPWYIGWLLTLPILCFALWWFQTPLRDIGDALIEGSKDAVAYQVKALEVREDYRKEHGVYPEDDPNHPAYGRNQSRRRRHND